MELHRLLKPGGRLIATVFGPGHRHFVDEAVGEEIIGMNVRYGYSWRLTAPLRVWRRGDGVAQAASRA